MKTFPAELSELLSPEGAKVLAGQHPLAGALKTSSFAAATGLLDLAMSQAAPALLGEAFGDLLVPLERRAPPAKEASQLMAGELLPKTVRVLTTPMTEDESAPVVQRARACGLAGMLESPSFKRFFERIAGFALEGPVGMQVLCYRPGDYAGPHTDHMPMTPRAKDGYLDVHLTFCTPGVERQLLVYEQDGHFTGVRDLAAVGGVTAYRLPFWHYTTPLEGQPEARRWLVLASFLSA